MENGIYISPDLPANHNMTGQEVDEFLDMPKEITDCITTDGLIKSILKYPHISLIFAGSNPQSGYILLKSKYSGLVELESRFDGGKYLLEMYRDRDPLGFDKTWELTDIGKYLVTGIYIEVMQSQYYSLNRLNNEDFKNLFMRSLEVYDLEMTEPEYFGYASIKFISTTLARMMLIGRYEPFVSLYNSNQWVLELTEFYNPVDTSTFELIHKKAIEYSKNIKK
ncbi:MAG: hypothetical protein ACM3RX_05835 [Methanococcaceae archaeon]